MIQRFWYWKKQQSPRHIQQFSNNVAGTPLQNETPSRVPGTGIAALLFASIFGALVAVFNLTENVSAQVSAAPPQLQQDASSPVQIAQLPTATATPTPRPTLSAPIGLISPTVSLTPTSAVTGATPTTNAENGQAPVRRTTVVTTQQILTATATPGAPGQTGSADDDAEVDADDNGVTAAADELQTEPLSGTIISNRGSHTARFFIEGQTIELAPSRATSFELPRSSTVLNLYNCAASTPESNVDCFWDPYIVQRDGFFEIYQSRPAGVNTVARLMLRAADTPPLNQVWVQNRSSNIESIVHSGDVIELLPAAVHEFEVDPGLPVVLYVRSCIVLQGQSACEWSPRTLDAGIYYALSEQETAGALSNSSVINIELRPVVGDFDESALADVAGSASNTTGSTTGGTPSTADSTTGTPNAGGLSSVLCRVQVPTLNIRSGPGLQYEIIGKIFSSQNEPGDVRVVGRSNDSGWLVVEPVVMADGWVISTESFILCDGDYTQLPLVQAPPPPVVQPAPAPVAQEPTAPEAQPEDSTATEEGEQPGDTDVAEDVEAVEEQPTAGVPEGYALLVVNNGFQHSIRFTIDQTYRPEVGPSEIDLEPGQSQNILVYPGSITFSVSTPWRGLSGNALIEVDYDTTVPLWIRFENDGSDTSWRLNW